MIGKITKQLQGQPCCLNLFNYKGMYEELRDAIKE